MTLLIAEYSKCSEALDNEISTIGTKLQAHKNRNSLPEREKKQKSHLKGFNRDILVKKEKRKREIKMHSRNARHINGPKINNLEINLVKRRNTTLHYQNLPQVCLLSLHRYLLNKSRIHKAQNVSITVILYKHKQRKNPGWLYLTFHPIWKTQHQDVVLLLYRWYQVMYQLRWWALLHYTINFIVMVLNLDHIFLTQQLWIT